MTKSRFISGVVIMGFLACVTIVATRREPEPALTATTGQVETADHFSTEATPPIPDDPAPIHAGAIGKNMSFFDILTTCGVTPQDINAIAATSKSVYDFRRVYPGQEYEFYADSTGGLDTFKLAIDGQSYIEVTKRGGEFIAERKEYPFTLEIESASGLISHSLFASIIDQSLPIELGAKIADIFAWDIDFFTEIQKNDYFRVIYEKRTRLDAPQTQRKASIGNIIAAEFNTRGVSHYAFLFNNEESMPDYFDQNGKSLRKQLLKAPLSYTRISSNFSNRRFHPVLHRYAPHHGIDYAAPAGTPVMSTGNGTVMVAGYRRGNGNYVKIRHTSNYITYYLHLSRFAKGIKTGVKVKQGQEIGYVGSTGYSTGPHLDYRVKKNGRFVNPRKIKLPPAKPVSANNMARFAVLRDRLIADMQHVPIEDWRTETFAGRESSARGNGGGGSMKNSSHRSITH